MSFRGFRGYPFFLFTVQNLPPHAVSGRFIIDYAILVGPNGATCIRVRVPGGEIFPSVDGDGDRIDLITDVPDEATGLTTGFGEYDCALSGQSDFLACPDTIQVTYIIPGEPYGNVTADVDVR